MNRNETKNTLGYLFGRMWHYSEGNRLNVGLYFLMSGISEIIDTIFGPIIWAKMILIVTVEGVTDQSIRVLYWLLSLIIARILVSWLFHGWARVLEQENAFKVRFNYRGFLMKGVMTLPLEWHSDHHSGDTIDKIGKGTTALFEFSEDSFLVIQSAIKLVGSYIALVYFSHSASYIVFGMLAVSALITMSFDRILIGQYKELNKVENHIAERVLDAVSNISTVIILRVEKLVFDGIMNSTRKPYDLFKRNIRLNEFKWFLTALSCNLMIVIVVGAYFWKNKGAAAGILVAHFYLLTSYLDKISELFYRFADMYSGIIRRKSRVMNAEELSDDFIEESFANHVLKPGWKRLDIRGLSFAYCSENGAKFRLDDISFSAARGERIALVGQTGSGKTTFLRVMRDLHHPEGLSLSVDGEEIPHGFEGIARAITLVQQKPEIFARTILENITMGAEYDMDFILKFTDMACFTDVAMALPKKFDSSIKEKGVNLSGGQQQRLALSRGLLACHDKDIILLDEPTSSLDAVTEIKVYENIFRGFRGKTIVSTIHQLHLLPLFDRICVFDNGKIVASGTLPELLTSCPVFVSLWEAMQKAAAGKRTEQFGESE